MKNIRNTVFLLSLASLSLMGGDLFAQSESMRLGYCTTDYSRGLVAQGQTGSHIYQAAIYLPSEILDKYVDDQIDAVEFAIKPMRGQMASVFVSTDLEDLRSNSLATATASGYGEGWNSVSLRKPVKIKKGMNLYVGYQILIGENEEYDCLLFDNSTYGVDKRNWYGLDDQWSNNTVGINRNLCIRAVVSGDNVPDNDISLMKLEPVNGSDYMEQNAPQSYYAYVQNNGLSKVNSFKLNIEAKTNGETLGSTADYGNLDIPNNEPQKILLENVTIPVEGNFMSTFSISKVNGEDDPYAADNSIQRQGYAYKEGSSPVARKVLFEEFTSEGYNESPAADEMHKQVIDAREQDDVVWVKHHRNYAGYADKFVIGEDNDYAELYGTSHPFVPASCYDRLVITGMEDSGPAYYVPYADQVGYLIDLAKTQPSFVSLDIKPTLKTGSNELGVQVSGHAGTNEMPLQTDLRLTTWLVEDNVKTDTQLGADSYVQNGVLRKVLSSSAWGDALDITGYDFDKIYNVTVNPEWNVNNLRVVSFVSNYSQNALKRTVYNTAEATLDSSTGVKSVETQYVRPFSVDAGMVVANSGYKIVEVCDVAGRKCLPTSLATGFYIVKTTDGKHTYTQKIYINR